MNRGKEKIVILGAGLSGLAAGNTLSKSGRDVTIIEGDPSVGGMAKTVNHKGFRFDLGGHRFLTKNKKIERFVKDILKGDFLIVSRKSSIYMFGRYFDYPLKPFNAVFGIGVITTLKIISDYCKEKAKSLKKPVEILSLEEWVVNNFGREMFNLYFKHYSEKVWGIDCNYISKEWVAQRIKELSLWEAIKNALFKFSGKDIATLADSFIYPEMGIGQISDMLRQQIEIKNDIRTNTKVIQIYHENFTIRNVTVMNCNDLYDIEGKEFISSIPLTNFIHMLQPSPPDDIIEAAAHLNYRDLVIVTIMLNRERVTDLTWMYLPERNIPIGRIHEPKNWSPRMAPEGKTHIVAEYFCFKGDTMWNTCNEELTALTVRHLANLGFINKNEVIDSCVVRVPNAYPVLDVTYLKYYQRIMGYLYNFTNLHITGRGGTFRYLNMDHAIETGIEVAEGILKEQLLNKEIESLLVGA